MSYLKAFIFLGALLGAPTLVSAGTLSLAWDPSPDESVVGYVVQWGDRSGRPTDEVNVGEVARPTLHHVRATVFCLSTLHLASSESVTRIISEMLRLLL